MGFRDWYVPIDFHTFKPVPKRITSYSSSMMIAGSQMEFVNLEETIFYE